ncbi:hypothetical protein [Paeniglutamicibacter sp. NPDC091659]|uniref:hypothetical protein n=1 Tax=Paeniglutamicibacter sp. NPDC091659 TaxID=3364389 RepID=UPI0038246F12
MDKSTGSLIENVFEQRIRASDRINQEFKATQITSGASGVLAYQAENPVEWDRTETLPYVDPTGAGFGDVELTITFTGDGTQEFPFVFPATDIRFNGTDEASKPVFREGGWWWKFGNWTGERVQIQHYDRPQLETMTDAHVTKWVIRFYYWGNVSYRVKLGARGTCGGTISVARTM